MSKQKDLDEISSKTTVTSERQVDDKFRKNTSEAHSYFEEALQVKHRIREFLLAIQFFTRLPVHVDDKTGSKPLSSSAWSFSLVGCFIGLIGGVVANFASGLPFFAAGLLAVGAMCALSGGLHEDGLADSADGLWGGTNPEQRLAIMHDSRVGVFGLIAVVTVICLKATAISHLLKNDGGIDAALVIITAAAISRGFLPMAMNVFPLASEKGRAAEAGVPENKGIIVGAIISIIIGLLLVGFSTSINGLIGGIIVAGGLGYIALKRLGGYNGDILGAQQQILETAILLAATI